MAPTSTDEEARIVCTMMELEAVSTRDFADATDAAIALAARHLPEVRWFEVRKLAGRVRDGRRTTYRVILRVGR